VDQHSTHRSHQNLAKEQAPPLVFTVEDNLTRTKYQISDYKRVCGTCKSMKQEVAAHVKRQDKPKRKELVAVDKLKQRISKPHIENFQTQTSTGHVKQPSRNAN